MHRGVGGTGVVGVLRSGNGEATIGLRADMDALPIEEANDVPYRSRNPGRMHACGHDGHTTMLLGAARYLAETRNFNGTVNFIFQPGEEGIGGALAMLEDGLFQRFPCNAVYGMHNRSGMPIGNFGISPAPRCRAARSSTSQSRARLARRAAGGRHRSGAGRLPHRHGAAIHRVAQPVAARNRGAVMSPRARGRRLQRDPETATLSGTVRAMKRETLTLVEEGMRRIVGGVARGFGAKAAVDFRPDLCAIGQRPEHTAQSPMPPPNWSVTTR